jgi:hypothetical protein
VRRRKTFRWAPLAVRFGDHIPLDAVLCGRLSRWKAGATAEARMAP